MFQILLKFIKAERGGVVKWLMLQTGNLMIASRMGSKPVRDKPKSVSLSKKLYTDCSVLVGSRNGFECFYKLRAFFTIKLK